MEFRREWRPAETEWGVTKVWSVDRMGHKSGERAEWYVPFGFASEADAQTKCDELNARKSAVTGLCEPQRYERKAGWVLTGTLPL